MDSEVALLKALAEPTRLRLAALLALNGETCVCELAKALAAPQFRVSRHLGIMRGCGLVEARREGTWMHYRLAAASTRFQECLQTCFRDCLGDHETVQQDLGRLAAGCCPSPEDQSTGSGRACH